MRNPPVTCTDFRGVTYGRFFPAKNRETVAAKPSGQKKKARGEWFQAFFTHMPKEGVWDMAEQLGYYIMDSVNPHNQGNPDFS